MTVVRVAFVRSAAALVAFAETAPLSAVDHLARSPPPAPAEQATWRQGRA